jgi:hypothetical protein
MKTFTYHTSHSFTIVDTNKTISFTTELYQLGIYAILNNDPALQFSTTPNELVKVEKGLIAKEAKGLIKNLTFGGEIKVTIDKNGLYKEIEL